MVLFDTFWKSPGFGSFFSNTPDLHGLGVERSETVQIRITSQESLLGESAIHIPVITVNSSVPGLEVYLTSTYSKKAPSTLSLSLAHQNLKNKKSSESRGNFKGNKQAVHEIITTNQHNLHVRIKKTSLDINHCSLA